MTSAKTPLIGIKTKDAYLNTIIKDRGLNPAVFDDDMREVLRNAIRLVRLVRLVRK